MPNAHNRGVNVIMPVYRGGPYWDLTLDSLGQARRIFNKVLMSFDGPTRNELVQGLKTGVKADIADYLLVTPTTMTATEHTLWLINQSPVSDWEDSQLVMLMAEDDLICVESLSVGLDAVKERENSILFGSWRIHEPDLDPTEIPGGDVPLEVTIYPENQIASQLTKWVNQGEVTTISGIAMEMRALRSYLSQVAGAKGGATLLSGVRTEFFLATQPSVKHMVRCTKPITLIQTHPQQEGSILARGKKNQDEALYQLWLCLTHQHVPIPARIFAALRLVKRLAQRPATLRALPSAWSTFRKVNHAT